MRQTISRGGYMFKIYVGCALTEAPDDFKSFVVRVKDALRAEGYEVMEFIGLVDGTPTDVYNYDINVCVADCDMLVGICDVPAIGLGYELGTSVEKHGKPTLALVSEDSRITRLVVGVECERNPKYRFRRYRNIPHIVELVQAFVAEMKTIPVVLSR